MLDLPTRRCVTHWRVLHSLVVSNFLQEGSASWCRLGSECFLSKVVWYSQSLEFHLIFAYYAFFHLLFHSCHSFFYTIILSDFCSYCYHSFIHLCLFYSLSLFVGMFFMGTSWDRFEESLARIFLVLVWHNHWGYSISCPLQCSLTFSGRILNKLPGALTLIFSKLQYVPGG